MADITRTAGDAFGVVHHDRGVAGSGAISADETVHVNGPVLNHFKVLILNASAAARDLRNELDVNESIDAIFKDIMGKATIEMYQVEGDATGQISVAVYPQGAWTAAALQTSIRALGSTVGSNNVDVTGSTVTDGGYDLA